MNTLIMHATCRKDYVRREDGVAKRWDSTWGFLIGEYETVSLGNMVCLQAGSYLLYAPPHHKSQPLLQRRVCTQHCSLALGRVFELHCC